MLEMNVECNNAILIIPILITKISYPAEFDWFCLPVVFLPIISLSDDCLFYQTKNWFDQNRDYK